LGPDALLRSRDLHFITFSCYRRHALLGSARRRDLLLKVLEQVRRRYQSVVVGYVVMPEHIHLLISEPERKNPSIVIQAIKLSFTRRVLGRFYMPFGSRGQILVLPLAVAGIRAN
jgi:putative transposase